MISMTIILSKTSNSIRKALAGRLRSCLLATSTSNLLTTSSILMTTTRPTTTTTRAFSCCPPTFSFFLHSDKNCNNIRNNQHPLSNSRCSTGCTHRFLSDNNNDVDVVDDDNGTDAATVEEEDLVPTIEQLTTDPFLKQTEHAAKLVALLEATYNQEEEEEQSSNSDGDKEEENQLLHEMLLELLQAQFSHAEGMRGFLATYLTAPGDNTPADQEKMPAPLLETLQNILKQRQRQDQEQDDGVTDKMSELLSLCCTHVIMPTAMTTLHDEQVLESFEQTRLCAKRGARVLSTLLSQTDQSAAVAEYCHAILLATAPTSSSSLVPVDDNNNVDPDLVEYWADFMEQLGYREPQKKDIQVAIQLILSSTTAASKTETEKQLPHTR